MYLSSSLHKRFKIILEKNCGTRLYIVLRLYTMSWSNSGFPIYIQRKQENFHLCCAVSKSQKLNDNRRRSLYCCDPRLSKHQHSAKDSGSILVLASISCLYVYPSKNDLSSGLVKVEENICKHNEENTNLSRINSKKFPIFVVKFSFLKSKLGKF